MPSIQDIADQINARLNLVATNTADTAQNTADIRGALAQTNGRLGQIEGTLATGLANLSQGLFALLEVQRAALALLDHHRAQNDTIICELSHGNELLCAISRSAARQERTGEAALASARRVEGIVERVHAAEAGDHDRNRELARQLAACCPPEPVPEAPCPEACPAPVHRDRRPAGQDWAPLQAPVRPDQPG